MQLFALEAKLLGFLEVGFCFGLASGCAIRRGAVAGQSSTAPSSQSRCPAARTIARMPARVDSGRPDHASTTASRSGSIGDRIAD